MNTKSKARYTPRKRGLWRKRTDLGVTQAILLYNVSLAAGLVNAMRPVMSNADEASRPERPIIDVSEVANEVFPSPTAETGVILDLVPPASADLPSDPSMIIRSRLVV